MTTHTRNNDLINFPEGVGSYSKGLAHGDKGIVDKDAFAAFLMACGIDSTSTTGTYSGSEVGDFETSKLALGSKGRGSLLNGPQAAFSGQLAGAASDSFGDTVVPPAPDLGSPEYWVELIELYWASILRDIPFSQYGTNATAKAAANELSSLRQWYKGPVDKDGNVTPELLFRGGFGQDASSFSGEREGPYLSQLCVTPTSLGSNNIDQKINTFTPGVDFGTSLKDWLNIQRGIVSDALVYDDTRRYMRSGRDTAAYTHSDELYQAYLIAFLVCGSVGITPERNPANPYFAYKKQKPFATFGGPDITGTIGAVARAAINAVWYQKWRVHLRHRPEYGGGLIELYEKGMLPAAVVEKLNPNIGMILKSRALAMSRLINKSALLSQTFPEGAPTHPAYPTGHGTVAGACITVLKFFLDGDATFANPVAPSEDGLRLIPYTGALTLNGELHKLGHNISFGHGVHAGIHWRSDTDYSLLLGEAVAISYLRKLTATFHEPCSIAIKTMSGSPLTFSNEESDMLDFDVVMNNNWSTSDCTQPDVPVAGQPDEKLKIEVQGNLLTITKLADNGSAEARIYGRRIVVSGGIDVFSILPNLPDHIEDPIVFKANGTAVTFVEGGLHRLRAVGTDTNTPGKCGGWIFNATELKG